MTLYIKQKVMLMGHSRNQTIFMKTCEVNFVEMLPQILA